MDQEPDLEALRALALVAEEHSISAAAARLGLSQQAVSLRVRGLERDLQVALLVRSARGSRLTRAGELVVGWAQQLFAASDDFSRAVQSLRKNRGQTLRIAASLTIAEHLLPGWIARWRSAFGDEGPLIRLTAENSSSVVEAVREGTADLGLVESPSVPADLGSVAVAHDTIEIVVPPGHPWARSAVSVRALAETPLILREEGNGTRRAFETWLSRAGAPLRAEPAAVHSTTLGMRSAIMAGVAPGALSSLAVAEDIRAGRLVRVEVRGLRIIRPLTAVWAGADPAPPVRAFLEVIEAP